MIKTCTAQVCNHVANAKGKQLRGKIVLKVGDQERVLCKKGKVFKKNYGHLFWGTPYYDIPVRRVAPGLYYVAQSEQHARHLRETLSDIPD